MTWWTAVDILPICGSGSVLLQSPVEIEARDWLGQACSLLCVTELRLSIQGGASDLWTQSDPSSWTQHPNRHLHLHKRPSRSGDADAWRQNLSSFSFWCEFLDFECLSSFSENKQKPVDVKRAASVCLKRGSEKMMKTNVWSAASSGTFKEVHQPQTRACRSDLETTRWRVQDGKFSDNVAPGNATNKPRVWHLWTTRGQSKPLEVVKYSSQSTKMTF